MGRRAPSRSDGRLLAGEGNEHFMFTVRATNSGKAFMQIATLEIGCHRLLDDRSPVAVLGLVPLERKLAEKSQNADRSNATSRRPADRRPSLRSGARGREQAVWHTAQPRKQRPIESHGRKSHGTQPIDPLRGGLTEGANAKVYMRTRIRAYTNGGPEATSHRLMVVNHWAYSRCEGGFFVPKPFSSVENLSTTLPPNSTDDGG